MSAVTAVVRVTEAVKGIAARGLPSTGLTIMRSRRTFALIGLSHCLTKQYVADYVIHLTTVGKWVDSTE